jgi:hypothetical protein
MKHWSSGELVTLTDRRFLWITECYRGARELYGSVTSWVHPDGVVNVGLNSSRAEHWITVSLRNGKIWKARVPEALVDGARKFVEIADAVD